MRVDSITGISEHQVDILLTLYRYRDRDTVWRGRIGRNTMDALGVRRDFIEKYGDNPIYVRITESGIKYLKSIGKL